MLSMKKLAHKAALPFCLSVALSFVGSASTANETVTDENRALTASNVVAQTDSTAPATDSTVDTPATDTPAVDAPATDAPAVDTPAEAIEEAPTAEIPAETRDKIEELLAITNASELNSQVLEGMIAQFRQISPEVPDEWWDSFLAKVDYEELNEIIIPIYAQNFTDEELDGIIAFYETPIGQSVLEKMPAVVQESLVAGQSWGLSIAQEIVSDLEADGYEPPVE